MKIRYLIIILTLLIIVSCGEKEKIIVKDLTDNDVNLLESNNEKIILVSNGMVCHLCVMNLNDFLAKKYHLKKYDYYLLYEDPKTIPARRWTVETYKNDYTPEIKKILFCSEDSNIQKSLNIQENMFKQLTPYVIYIDKEKKPVYFAFESIFNKDGKVKKSFKIK
jgi:hypothetical protein